MQRTLLFVSLPCWRVTLPFRPTFRAATVRTYAAPAAHPFRTNKPPRRPPISPARTLKPDDVLPHLQSQVLHWSQRRPVKERLVKFGIPQTELPGFLRAFVKDVFDGLAFLPEEHSAQSLARLAQDLSDTSRDLQTDRILTSTLFAWACDPKRTPAILKLISDTTLFTMKTIHDAVDFTRLQDRFPSARSLHRKIIMHVGPTNSGKTHNALRALAAAKRGAYAGPLRLLAHEVCDRLNTGQIIPLGVDLEASVEPDEETNFDAVNPSQPQAIRKVGDPRYARPCNLVTGEERRLIEGASMYSCTVEMLALDRPYDVVVIDEIQMIGDSDRGVAWTVAVLGAVASEVHLCGEETAVPVIEALVAWTGDELVVNRYQRLSGLTVAEKSLENDLTRIRKGDCIVTFSRSGIFALRDEVQKVTGLRCAVAYGRLPPEIRSEQASLFNDTHSGYDVMIGSDAIGMGLNLKIRRVVFERLAKFNGTVDKALSYSQIKQIAGRAGRYGMHANSSQVGIVTTLSPDDLPLLKAAMEAPVVPLPHARTGYSGSTVLRLLEALPMANDASTIRDALMYVSTLPPHLSITDHTRKDADSTDYLYAITKDLSLKERALFMLIPFPFADIRCRQTIGAMLIMYRDQGAVDLYSVLQGEGLLDSLDYILRAREAGEPVKMPETHLKNLETLHKCLVAYAWCYMHFPGPFYAYQYARIVMTAAEQAMDYALQQKKVKRMQTIGVGSPPADRRQSEAPRSLRRAAL